EPNEDGLPTVHRLRDTFSTAAAEVGISEKVVDALTNHKGESVTKGYQRPGMPALKDAAEKISYHLQTQMGIAQPKADPNAELLAELKAARAEREQARAEREQARKELEALKQENPPSSAPRLAS